MQLDYQIYFYILTLSRQFVLYCLILILRLTLADICIDTCIGIQHVFQEKNDLSHKTPTTIEQNFALALLMMFTNLSL